MTETYKYYRNKYGYGEYPISNDSNIDIGGVGIYFWKIDRFGRFSIHRLDGPAIIWKDGDTEWWIDDTNITGKITPWANNVGIDLDNLTDDDKVLIKLTWDDYRE